MKKIVLLFAFICLSIVSFGQDSRFWNDNRFYVEAGLRKGNYIPFVQRHAYIKELSQYGLDIKLGKQTDGQQDWEGWFNYPTFGLLLRYEHNTLDSAKYEHRNETGTAVTDWVAIGDCYTAGAYINGHIFRADKWSFDYDIVGGLSFWPKYGNEFIGSLMNVHLSIDAGPTVRISENIDLLARAIFSHSSNGALVLPNNGVNLLSYEMSLRYHPNGRPDFNEVVSKRLFTKTTALYASESFGWLQTNTRINGQIPGETDYYFGNLVQLGVTRQFSPKFRYNFGFDFAWTGETKLNYELAEIRSLSNSLDSGVTLEEYSPMKATHIAFSGMFEILYNKVSFCIGAGYYLNHGIYIGTDQKKTWCFSEDGMTRFEKQYLPDAYKNYYERLGFKYYFGKTQNMYAGAFMKVHMDSIDYIEWTYGIHLKQWNNKSK